MVVMVFNTTFNNISVTSWGSVLLVEETGESHRHAASHWQTLSHIVVSSWAGFEFATLAVIITDCIDSCKSNYHTITTVPYLFVITKYTLIICNYGCFCSCWSVHRAFLTYLSGSFTKAGILLFCSDLPVPLQLARRYCQLPPAHHG
jgi:hypothetical protein